MHYSSLKRSGEEWGWVRWDSQRERRSLDRRHGHTWVKQIQGHARDSHGIQALTILNPRRMGDIIASPDPAYRWLVPGLLERQDRFILTGNEGRGKSTLLQQFAAQISLGIHPVTGDKGTPRKVYLLDCENSEIQTRRKFKRLFPLAITPSDYLIADFQIAGLDLNYEDDREALYLSIAKEQPDLLVSGPIYKLSTNMADELQAKVVLSFFDKLRADFDIAIMLEAHEPHEVQGVSKDGYKSVRPSRPVGSSIQKRWPEFGYCLYDDGRLSPWRGQRDERMWPVQFRKGVYPEDGGTDQWPFVVDATCLGCGKPLDPESSRKYCSDKCADAFRKRKSRAKEASGMPPSLDT